MEDALAAGLIKQLQPAFYVIGVLTVLLIVAFGSAVIKLLWDSKKDRDKEIDLSIVELNKSFTEGLKEIKKAHTDEIEKVKDAIVGTTVSVAKLDTKVDITLNRFEKNLNSLGSKVRAMENN